MQIHCPAVAEVKLLQLVSLRTVAPRVLREEPHQSHPEAVLVLHSAPAVESHSAPGAEEAHNIAVEAGAHHNVPDEKALRNFPEQEKEGARSVLLADRCEVAPRNFPEHEKME